MAAHPDRKRYIALATSFFLLGALAGGALTSTAASRAARVQLGGAALLFEYDQEQKLAAAWNAGDMNKALSHAVCAYETEFGGGERILASSSEDWSIWGRALVDLLIVRPNTATAKKARPIGEAIARAKVAVVEERLGLATEAQHELAEAVRVSGAMDEARWRDLGLKSVAVAVPSGDAKDHR